MAAAVALLTAIVAGAAPASEGAEPPRRIALGAYIPHALEHPGMIDRYGRSTGRRPVIVSSYKQWKQQPFVSTELDGVWGHGAVPMITWEPWTLSGRSFPLRAIAAGRYDGYLRRSALAAAAWDRPILVRFAHEMNGNWYPWGRGVRGSTARAYKHAWRHVVEIFRREGADNVLWVWSPNINNSGKYPFRQYYPGDAWVDWVGPDGFNWALGREWKSFSQVFARTYAGLSRLSSRPMLICETGSSQRRGRSKAAWMRRALKLEIPRFERIEAVVWFNEKFNGIDPRVNSSRRALSAFRSVASTPRYALPRSQLLGMSESTARAVP